MVVKFASQIAVLNAEIAKLDAELVSNPHWQALTQKNQSTPIGSAEIDSIYRHLRLEQELACDPVYRARVKLLEAVQILQQIPAEAKNNGAGLTDAATVPATGAAGQPKPPATAIASLSAALDTKMPGTVPLESKSEEVSVSNQDDLMRIRGVTRSLNEKLVALGVTHFQQIADWTSADRHAISAQLGLDREISRQNWIAQAALLASQAELDATAPRSQSRSSAPAPASALPATAPKIDGRAPLVPSPLPVSAGTIQTNAPQRPAADASPGPLEHQSEISGEISGALIKSAALGVIRKLEVTHDATPPLSKSDRVTARHEIKSVPETSVMPVVSHAVAKVSSPLNGEPPRLKPSLGSTPLHPQSQIIFSPQIVPEPRRVVADHERQHKKADDPARAPEQDVERSIREAAPQKTEQQPQPDVSSSSLTTQPVLPKDKLRFRRLKPKSKTAAQGTSGEPSQSPSMCDGHAVEPHRSASSNPLAPPPVPKQPKKPGPFKNRRWLRQRAQRASSESSGRPSFGDGQPWREPDPVLTGPALTDDMASDSRIYGHMDEASVEIIRPRANTQASTDPVASPSRKKPEPEQQGQKSEKIAKSVRRHPAKRIFGALKRE